MAWVKIPAENHALFLASLPRDPRVTTKAMFGGLCTMVGGNMAAGLFARSAFVTLDEAGVQEVLAMDGGAPFDPMGNGKAFVGRVMLPESILDEPAELRDWLRRAIDYTATMPAKSKSKPKPKPKPMPKPMPKPKPKSMPKPTSIAAKPKASKRPARAAARRA
jgi:TfoX/Sxy family transcriptional regulator of competence genes